MIAPEQLVLRFKTNRWAAHQFLFRRRHPDAGCKAHAEIVRAIYSTHPRVSIEGFRGLGKSTYLEEGAVLKAVYREFQYGLILSASYEMGCMRLDAIKNEFVVNDLLLGLFGEQKTDAGVWRENRIILANGVCIQALGREQSMTGIKYRDTRPDFVLIDDVEDPKEVRTDAERGQTWRWFLQTFLPSLDDPAQTPIRMLATRRGSGSLPERVELAGWKVAKFPVEYTGDDGKRRATWPGGKFGLDQIDVMRQTYRADMHTWAQEYMCQAVSEQDRVFERPKCEPRARSWEATFAMYDPARTAHQQSATTGKAVWSYHGSRVVFWEVKAETWLPDQIIADIFETQARYECTWDYFEEDGLNQWALQPIRAEMLRRRTMLPLKPVKAPRNKQGFIQGLQPGMKAGEIVFAGPESEFQDAIEQFLSFPRGKIDAPNACAYALLLRPGTPVYDGFSDENINDSLLPISGVPLYLAANSDGSVVTAVLVQRAEGEIRVLADWVREGVPSEVVGDIYAEASLAAEAVKAGHRVDFGDGLKMPVYRDMLIRLPLNWVVPAWHRDQWRNVGLAQAIREIPAGLSASDGGERGRLAIQSLLHQHRVGYPRFRVNPAARWTCRALSGGYTKSVDARGLSAANPDAGIYRLLMEGLEAFAGIGLGVANDDGVRTDQPIGHDRFGNAYRSAMPVRR